MDNKTLFKIFYERYDEQTDDVKTRAIDESGVTLKDLYETFKKHIEIIDDSQSQIDILVKYADSYFNTLNK